VTGAQTSALVVALVGPIVVLVGAGGRRAGSGSRPPPFRRVQAGLVVAAGAWLVLVVSGAGHAGAFHVTPLAASAGCGAALIGVAAVEGTTRRRSLSGTCAALTAVGVSLTAGSEGATAAGVVGGLALAAVLTADLGPGPAGTSRRRRMLPALLAAGGVAAGGSTLGPGAGAGVGAGAIDGPSSSGLIWMPSLPATATLEDAAAAT